MVLYCGCCGGHTTAASGMNKIDVVKIWGFNNPAKGSNVRHEKDPDSSLIDASCPGPGWRCES